LVYPREVVDRWRYRVIRTTFRDSIRFTPWYSCKIALVATGDFEDQTSSATDCVLARDLQWHNDAGGTVRHLLGTIG
jgi:hypothetical protein